MKKVANKGTKIRLIRQIFKKLQMLYFPDSLIIFYLSRIKPTWDKLLISIRVI